MTSVLHIARRVVLVAAALVVALVAGLVLFARTDYARGRLREEVRAALMEQLGLEATFGEVELELFPPRGHVLEVRVTGADGETLLEVDRLTVGFGAAALLRGEVELTELTLEEPRIRLVVEGGRIANLPRLRSPASSEGGGDALSDIGVLAGVVELEWRDAPGGPVHARLEDANLDVNRDAANGDVDVRLLVTGGALSQGAERLPIELLQGRVMVQAERREALARGVRLRLGEVRATVPAATVGLEAPFDVQGSVELWAPLALVAALPIAAPPLEGQLRLSAGLRRQAGRLVAEGDVLVEGLVVGPEFIGENRAQSWGPHAIGDLAGSFGYSPERLTMAELTVERPAEGDGRVVVRDLVVGLAEPELPIDAEVTLEDVELANVLIDAGLYASRVRARIDGTTTLHGQLRDLRLRFLPLALRLRGFSVLTASVTKPDAAEVLSLAQATVRGRVVVDRDAVRIRNFVAAFGRSQLSVRADLGVRGPGHSFELTAQAVEGGFHLEDVGTIAGLELRGSGPIRARIHGRYPDPSLEGSVDLTGFRLGRMELGEVRGPVRWRRTTITLPETAGRRGQSAYRLEGGRIEFARGGVVFEGLAHLEPVHAADFVEMLALESPALRRAGGAVAGEARIRFQSRGERVRVELAGTTDGVSYDGERLGGGPIALTYDEGAIEIERLELRDGEARASATGRIGRDGELDLEVAVPRYPIGAIESLPGSIRAAEGRLRGAVRLSGEAARPSGLGWIELSPIVHHGQRFGPSRLTFELDEGVIRAEGGLAGRVFQVEDATFRMERPYLLWVQGRVAGLEVGSLLPAGRLPAGLSVRLDGELDAGIELRDSPRLDGRARIDSLVVRHPAFQVRATEPVELGFERRRVAVATARYEITSSALRRATGFTLGGQVSDAAVDLRLRGVLDLGFVPAALEAVETLEGTLDVDCQIGGPFDEPSLAGEAHLRVSRLQLRGVPYPAEDLRGVLRFSQSAVLAEDLTARLLGGRATASGRLALEGLRLGGYQLRLGLRDATLPFGARSSAIANAALTLTSPADEGDLPLVSGRLELVRFIYEEPITLTADLGGLGRQRIEAVRTFDPADDVLRLEVELVGGGNLRIHNNLARATVVIDDSVRPFRLVGTNQALSLLGRLVVERRGTVTWRDTDFEIERGVLEFEDAFDIDPRLDFVASASRRDWLITLQVGGTRRQPTVSFSSDPPLAEEDIALLLTVGLTRQETEQLGYGGAAISAAPEILSQVTGLDRELNRLVPMLDEVRITTDYSPRTGRPEPRVRVGRRLTEGIRIGASAGLAEHRDFQATFETEITDSLSFDLEYETETDFGLGNIGGDLRWRIEF